MSNHLRALREKAGLSQDTLAQRMGTTRSQLVKLERGGLIRADLFRVLA